MYLSLQLDISQLGITYANTLVCSIGKKATEQKLSTIRLTQKKEILFLLVVEHLTLYESKSVKVRTFKTSLWQNLL